MTSRSADKAAARALVDLTSAPYQSCLTAVAVLRGIPQPRDLGMLEAVLAGVNAQRLLELPISDKDVAELERLTHGGEWLTDDSTAVLYAQESDYVEAYVELEVPELELPAGVSLVLDVYIEGGMPRDGKWRCSARQLLAAARTADATGCHPGSALMTVIAEPTEADTPPIDEAADTYMSDLFRSADFAPIGERRGLLWSSASFPDLGLVDNSSPDHRLEECDGGQCGYLHDWPCRELDRNDLELPTALVRAWKSLARLDPERISNESRTHRLLTSTCAWYGLELPSYSTLWLQDRRSVR